MLIDAHTHLNLEDLFVDYPEHLANFQKAGGKILVNAGAHIDYNHKGILIAQQAKTLFPELIVKATLGFHPEDAKDIAKSDFSALMEQLEQQYLEHSAEVIAIGECGIDLYRVEKPDLDHQQMLLRLQAELARKLDLPLIIHSREGFEETLAVLQEFTDLKIYFHCWGYGSPEILKLESIFPQIWFGFTNILSYPSAQKTRESFLATKREHLLLETDAPFLPPQIFRGQKNFPAHVRYVYQKATELLDIPLLELESLIEKNFTTIFP
ncbi:MAG: TatD family hydrolase [Candidatus Peribacteria bacterium]|jgi:TatD DNase family protein|nr:TatD family hydrolase [Candidatus Peribacteria bacterium]